MRIIVIILILALVGLQYKLWFSDVSIPKWSKLEQKRKLQEEENERLLARNKSIETEITELKSGDDAIEEQARYELGMIKKNETYYQFSD